MRDLVDELVIVYGSTGEVVRGLCPDAKIIEESRWGEDVLPAGRYRPLRWHQRWYATIRSAYQRVGNPEPSRANRRCRRITSTAPTPTPAPSTVRYFTPHSATSRNARALSALLCRSAS